MSGNQAIALGAVAAGVKYFAGYPITPASDILEWLSAKLPQVGGITIQCEDEIASIASVLGASYTGAKAMTATSGPGLSLMTEVLGYAGTAEIPCVIVDAQRGGPSTGLPTKTEQSDLQHALYGGHGEAPRVVLAPVTVEDCFWTTIDAFNYAERYQVPVILLTDQGLATDGGHPQARPLQGRALGAPHLRRARTATTSATRSPRTRSRRWASPARRAASTWPPGIEHDELGPPAYTPENHVRMQTKRWAKLDPLRNGVARHETVGDERPDIAVIGFGSTYGPAREAVEAARAQGLSVGAFYPRVLGAVPGRRRRTPSSGQRAA